MKNRMSKVRLLAGGLAAIITMSSMTPYVFAAEDETIVQAVEETEATEDETIVQTVEETEATEETGNQDIEETKEETNDSYVTEAENAEVDVTEADVESTDLTVEETEGEADDSTVETSADEAMTQTEETENTEDADTKQEENADTDTTTENNTVLIEDLVSTIEKINPVKINETLIKEYEENGVFIKSYLRGDNEYVDRLYYPDGSFVEKISSGEYVVHPPRVAGQPAPEPIIIPPRVKSTRVCNVDGTWEETIYDKEVQISQNQYSAEEMSKIIKAENRTLKQLADAESLANSDSLEDVLDFFNSLDTDIDISYVNPDGNTDGAKEKIEMPVDNEVPTIVRQAFSYAFDKVMSKIPGSSLISGTVKGIVLKAYHMDDKKPSDISQIKTRLEENMVETSKLITSATRLQEVVSSISSAGKPLDEFTNNCQTLAETVSLIVNNNLAGSDNNANMLVSIASLIGTPDNWIISGSHIMKDFANAAAIFKAQNGKGSASDPKGRNIYELFYDYNKETSMFSGEAIDKSANQIQSRLQNFAANCDVLLDVLNIQEKVANFTDEEIESLSAENKSAFEKIRANKQTIDNQKKLIANAFLGSKDNSTGVWSNGIIGAVKEYSSKSRNIFIEKLADGFKEIQLSSTVSVSNAESVNPKALAARSALTKDQICQLQQHVNATGLTMEEYLERMGFDLSPIKNSGRQKAYLSTLDGSVKKSRSGHKSGTNTTTFTGIDMKTKNATEASYQSYYKTYGFFGYTKEEKMDDSVVVILRMEK